jgi:hypothetical protein
MATTTKNTSRKTPNLALSALILASSLASASEIGGSSYPVGVEIAYGDMLRPGFYQLMYLNKSQARAIKGNSGQDLGWSRYAVDADTVSFRMQYVWASGLLGASVESGASIPFPALHLEKRISPILPDASGRRFGLGDPLFFPLRLAWKGDRINQSVNFEFIAPLGAYDAGARVNTGRNYWQLAPLYAVSWRPNDNSVFGLKLRYGMNTENPATNYKSGDELTAEFSAGYRTSPRTTLGLQGYLFRQTTDDQLNGQSTSAANGGLIGTGVGNRGSANAIGPFISHVVSPGFVVVAKYQQEFNVKNRGEFSRFWLQTLLPF